MWRLIREGFILGPRNPKSIVFLVALLTQFVEYASGGIPFQLGELAAVFLVIALVSDSMWAFAAGTAHHWSRNQPTGSQSTTCAPAS